jgi:O-antigen ligase
VIDAGNRGGGAARSPAARLRAALRQADAAARSGAGLFLPAALVLGSWLVATYFSGGYFARYWYPAGIGLLALLAVTVVAGGRALPRIPAARVALLLLAGFVAWSYLSVLWAGSPASALEASNKLLVFLLTAWIVALVPWSKRSASVFLAAWSTGVAAVCVTSLLGAVNATEFSGFLYAFRFQDPIGYVNGNAALALMAFFPALTLSYRRRIPPLLQGLLLADAAFLVEFSLLTQSRAAAFGGAAVVLLYVAIAPDRLRLVPRLGIVVGALALAAPAILDVYSTAKAGQSVAPAIDEAAKQIAWTTPLAGVLGAALGFVERAIRPKSGRERRVRQVEIGAVTLVGIVAAALLFAHGGRALNFVRDEFRSLNGDSAGSASTRFTKTTLYERPDYWRVALDLFDEHPVAGVGAGNFERQYTALRNEPKYSRYAHNIWLRALSEGGIVGIVLLLAFVFTAFGAALGSLGRLDGDRRAVVVACLAAAAYFFVHASFDWLEEIPALAGPALGLAFIGIAVARGPATEERRDARASRWRSVGIVSGLALGLAALVALVPPYLSLRFVETASSNWRADPRQAFHDLDRAAALNPLSSEPRTVEGTIAVSLGEERRARGAFRRALELEQAWYPHLELALLEARAGRFRAARAEIAQAQRLSHKDPFIEEADRRIRRRERVDPAAFNRAIARQTREAFARPQR